MPNYQESIFLNLCKAALNLWRRAACSSLLTPRCSLFWSWGDFKFDLVLNFPSKHSVETTGNCFGGVKVLGGREAVSWLLNLWGLLGCNVNQFGIGNFVFLPPLVYFSWDLFLKQFMCRNEYDGSYLWVCSCRDKLRPNLTSLPSAHRSRCRSLQVSGS